MNSGWDTGCRVTSCSEPATEVEKVQVASSGKSYEIAVCARHATYLRVDALNFAISANRQQAQG